MKRAMFLIISVLVFTTGISAEQSKIAVITDFVGDMLPANGSCAGLGMPRGICIANAGKAFYSIYPDEYDALVFMTTKNLTGMNDPKQAYVTKADIKGINYTSPFGNPEQVGSAGRLMVAAVVGSLASLPDDPLAPFTTIPVAGVEVLAHEIAHRWLAYVDIDLGDGSGKSGVLRQSSQDQPWNHWSSWFNTESSVQYGGELTDNGDGTFTDNFGVRKFGPLDQYLMGIRPKEEVGPMFFVRVNYNLGSPDNPGTPGTTRNYEGERVDFTIDDIIRANGEREPESSPCHLKIALVLVHPANIPPTQFELDKAESYRVALENWWNTATDGRGTIDTDVNRCGVGTEQCPGIAAVGCEAVVNDDDTMPDEDVYTDDSTVADNDTVSNDEAVVSDGNGTADEDMVSGDNSAVNDENTDKNDDETTGSDSKSDGCSVLFL